mmetsp:Transcript_5852/g.22978  ORF Transcript_5852/g.22978 Transcript_5852/m.22978 type:complete len:228 (+) Transcript_5852:1342-2025(+)
MAAAATRLRRVARPAVGRSGPAGPGPGPAASAARAGARRAGLVAAALADPCWRRVDRGARDGRLPAGGTAGGDGRPGQLGAYRGRRHRPAAGAPGGAGRAARLCHRGQGQSVVQQRRVRAGSGGRRLGIRIACGRLPPPLADGRGDRAPPAGRRADGLGRHGRTWLHRRHAAVGHHGRRPVGLAVRRQLRRRPGAGLVAAAPGLRRPHPIAASGRSTRSVVDRTGRC